MSIMFRKVGQMEKQTTPTVDESKLTKGQLRKLNALRKSVGNEVGEWAFAEWLQNRSKPESTPVDKTAELITTTLYELVEQKRLKFRHGGYLVRRGRGRVIVEPAKSE